MNYSRFRSTDQSEDIQGDLGLGLLYSLHTSDRLKIEVELEGQGLYGQRVKRAGDAVAGASARSRGDADNDLYGGIGRTALRAAYELGTKRAWRRLAKPECSWNTRPSAIPAMELPANRSGAQREGRHTVFFLIARRER